MTFNSECYIEIPADKLREACRFAYDLSSPQGLGFLHAKRVGLSDDEVDEIIRREGFGRVAAHMDYVHGRSCKFVVFRDGEYPDFSNRLWIRSDWYDHSDRQLEELLMALGIDDPAAKIASAQAAQRAENEHWERENDKRDHERQASSK